MFIIWNCIQLVAIIGVPSTSYGGIGGIIWVGDYKVRSARENKNKNIIIHSTLLSQALQLYLLYLFTALLLQPVCDHPLFKYGFWMCISIVDFHQRVPQCVMANDLDL